MDLLGSILNSMDKPPTIGDKQKILIKKQKEEIMKKQQVEREKLNKFREDVEMKINNFLQDEGSQKLKFTPMDQVYRRIIHDVADDAGMSAFSFGEEGVDRYIIVYKKEYLPSDDELNTLRNGEEWSEEKGKEILKKRELERQQEEDEARRIPDTFVPTSNYKEKYQHLIGLDSAKDAARKTETNKQYGFVPSENKKDVRSIEQTLADIQTKKRQKLNHNLDQKHLFKQ
uniref:R3H domain-containing protein n=1 Tax=Clastoptera arizonana TaxID=38151 RepID=A0A1B6D687_9HEMI